MTVTHVLSLGIGVGRLRARHIQGWSSEEGSGVEWRCGGSEFTDLIGNQVQCRNIQTASAGQCDNIEQ